MTPERPDGEPFRPNRDPGRAGDGDGYGYGDGASVERTLTLAHRGRARHVACTRPLVEQQV